MSHEDGHENAGHPHEHFAPVDAASLATREGVRATWISLAALMVTALLQLLIVGATGSVALLADTIHNFTDALTAVPLLIAFRLARRPATRRYPYGFHRAEDLAGIAIVAMILLSAVFAAAEAVQRLIHPQAVDHVGWVLAAGLIGAAGNEGVAAYRIRIGRRIGSAAMVADGLHARTDGLTSLAVVASALGVMAGFPRADAVVGLTITIAIFWTLQQAARTVLHRALDGTDDQTITLIEEVAAAVAGVEHVTDAKARWTGHQLRAELSIDVDAALSVAEGHDVAEHVREALLHHVPRLADAAVHVDPHEHEPHAIA
jgi:cation diffusion facilitator family transporter